LKASVLRLPRFGIADLQTNRLNRTFSKIAKMHSHQWMCQYVRSRTSVYR